MLTSRIKKTFFHKLDILIRYLKDNCDNTCRIISRYNSRQVLTSNELTINSAVFMMDLKNLKKIILSDLHAILEQNCILNSKSSKISQNIEKKPYF